MLQRLDLHVHSTCSDGALSVPDLLERALAADIQTLALTDHDTIKGLETAREWLSSNSDARLQLISGSELSCVWQGVTIHVVGLNFDVQNAVLGAYLQGLDHARSERAELIASRRAKHGFKGALAGAPALAGEAQHGRPHFAR